MIDFKQFEGHTKGPWAMTSSFYKSDLFGPHTGFNVTANFGQRPVLNITLNNAPGIPDEEREANARLTAAAPDLLAENKNLRELISGLLAVCQEAIQYVHPEQWGDKDATFFLIKEAEAALNEQTHELQP